MADQVSFIDQKDLLVNLSPENNHSIAHLGSYILNTGDDPENFLGRYRKGYLFIQCKSHCIFPNNAIHFKQFFFLLNIASLYVDDHFDLFRNCHLDKNLQDNRLTNRISIVQLGVYVQDADSDLGIHIRRSAGNVHKGSKRHIFRGMADHVSFVYHK